MCACLDVGECYTFSVDNQGSFTSEIGWQLKNGGVAIGVGSSPGSASTCDTPTSPPSVSSVPTVTFRPTPSPTVQCNIELGGENDGYQTEYLGLYTYVGQDEVSRSTNALLRAANSHVPPHAPKAH